MTLSFDKRNAQRRGRKDKVITIDNVDVSPKETMAFAISMYSQPSKSSAGFSGAQYGDYLDRDRNGQCLEACMFPKAVSGLVVAIRQSHAPCSVCIAAFAGWANSVRAS
jgi:hypothetical protein